MAAGELISFILPARNARQWTERALFTIAHSIDAALQWRERVECILIDDNSDAELGVAAVMTRFREQTKLPTRRSYSSKRHQHYCGVFAAGLSLARGGKVFFLSNDMVFTPAFFGTRWDVSNLDPTIGIVRGTSNFTDSHTEHQVLLPFPLRGVCPDVLLFSEFAARWWKQEFVEDRLLSGDAVLINRSLIDAIGVIDRRFFGYFGDIDYGFCGHCRAGFKMVCAEGGVAVSRGGWACEGRGESDAGGSSRAAWEADGIGAEGV